MSGVARRGGGGEEEEEEEEGDGVPQKQEPHLGCGEKLRYLIGWAGKDHADVRRRMHY